MINIDAARALVVENHVLPVRKRQVPNRKIGAWGADVGEVSQVLKYCNDNMLAVVPQGGNSGQLDAVLIFKGPYEQRCRLEPVVREVTQGRFCTVPSS